jgi:hypothetical protein
MLITAQEDISGNNALPSDFEGSETGTTVKTSGGPYALSESNPNTGSLC